MERNTILQLVTSYIDQAIGGLEIENPKCDFKSKWYDFGSPRDLNEFLKDTSAIANTFGPDGFIVIGYDLNSKSFTQTSFSDSNLRDTAMLSDVINKRIDRLFEVSVYDFNLEGNNVSVIHIPPSIDKPHVIRNYQTFDKTNKIIREEQHRIFVRKNTSTYPASKYDIELMFYDRKNITPEYDIQCSYHIDTLNFNASSHHDGSRRVVSAVKSSVNLIFENVGRRPVAIIRIEISFSLFEDPSDHEIIHFSSEHDYKDSEIIILPNQIVGIVVSLRSDFYKHGYDTTLGLINELNKGKKHICTPAFIITLSTGQKLKCDLTKVIN